MPRSWARPSASRGASGCPAGDDRPIPEPEEFYIDVDICMNCGFCAEYCPFDAIIMDHDFEIASYSRNVYNMEKLLKPASNYKAIRPENYERNEAERKAKEAAKAAKAAKDEAAAKAKAESDAAVRDEI